MKHAKEFSQKLLGAIQKDRPIVLEQVPPGAKALIASILLDELKQTVLYISAESSCSILDDLEFFGKTALELPHKLELEASPDILGLELKTLSSLKHNPS